MTTDVDRGRNASPVAPLPAPLRWSRALLLLLVVIHLAVPVVMWVERGALTAQIAAQHPEFDAATLRAAGNVALISAVVFHLVWAVIAAVLAARLPQGRRLYRGLAVASQVVATLAGVVSWSTSPMFHVVVPVVTVVELVLLALVTLPSSSRRHFTGSRAV